ncbi:MAG: cyclodeaminase/cyclohydrolase family protein, partial [Candidatus Marinimicrobia bacterium]|nr:cyclodeaminase/cyclohydrolase family protein [Candidatus Neomarinimicrobiota bacterium]
LGVPTADIVECAVQSLGLNDVTKFDPQEKIIDYAVQSENRPLMSLTGTDFVKELSTNSPAPGGGSVAALAGALGAALLSMVAALTHEKKEMLETKPEMDIIGVEAQTLKDRLTFLVDEDTEAFNKVMDANRMAETNDNEQKIKDKAVEVANKYAIEIPMETAEKCFRVIELAEILVEKGNPNSVSDAGVAAEVALAGVSGACMNVLINLPGIEDEDYCDSKRDQVETIMEKAESLEKIVFEKTMDVINK